MTHPESPTHPYTVQDVERLLGLPRTTLRALVVAGFVSPQRGPRNRRERHAMRIGFIGLGQMGSGMAANLLSKGWPLTVMAHRRREAVEALKAQGASEAATPKELAQREGVSQTAIRIRLLRARRSARRLCEPAMPLARAS